MSSILRRTHFFVNNVILKSFINNTVRITRERNESLTKKRSKDEVRSILLCVSI